MSYTLLLFALLLQVQLTQVQNTPLLQKAYDATAILYVQTEDGGMKTRCTATAFEKTADGYRFVTASHCVAQDDTEHRQVEVEKTRFFVTFDEVSQKRYFEGKVLWTGYQHNGDDFSELAVKSNDNWPTIPLGDEKQEKVGDAVLNVANPLGLGRQAFHGWISQPVMDRPVIEGEINWMGAMLLQISLGPGSSGSSVVSVKQEAIVGFIVGTISGNSGSPNAIAMPVSRFKSVRQAVKDNKYKWFKPDE